MACTYPVHSKLALASTPKLCGAIDAFVAVNVPYRDRSNKLQTQQQHLCLLHACDVAVWKCLRNIPRNFLTEAETHQLLSFGFSKEELMAEGLVPIPGTSNEC